MAKKILFGFLLICLVLLFLIVFFYYKESKKLLLNESQKKETASAPRPETQTNLPRKDADMTEVKSKEASEETAKEVANNNPQAESPNLYIEEFGVTTGTPIEAGFFFYDGQYIDAPYKVESKGLGVFVNDLLVWRMPISEWPIRFPSITEDPGFFPNVTTLTKDTTYEEFEELNRKIGDPIGLKYTYLLQHFPFDEAVEKLVEYYAALPFVQEVMVEHERMITLKTTHNAKINAFAMLMPVKNTIAYWTLIKPPSKEEVLRQIEFRASRFKEQLMLGACRFYFSKADRELILFPDKVNNDLPEIIEVLKSNKLEEEKIEEFEELHLISYLEPLTNTLILINQFESSAQLEKRIKQIKDNRTGPRKEYPLTAIDDDNIFKLQEERSRTLGRRLTWEEEKQIEQEYLKQKHEKKSQREEERKKQRESGENK